MVKPDGQADDTEARILDAAHRVFLRKGTAGARTQEIADEAGVNKALLHYYFRSKERLAEAVFRQAAMRLFPPIVAILTSDLPIAEKVQRVVEHEFNELLRAPYLPGYILSELNLHPERAAQLIPRLTGMSPQGVGAMLLEKIGAQIDAEVRAGRMRAIPAQQFVVNLVSLCIFPFAARPMLKLLLETDDDGFHAFIEQRRAQLPTFFLEALRP